jgi:hypothetical protein
MSTDPRDCIRGDEGVSRSELAQARLVDIGIETSPDLLSRPGRSARHGGISPDTCPRLRFVVMSVCGHCLYTVFMEAPLDDTVASQPARSTQTRRQPSAPKGRQQRLTRILNKLAVPEPAPAWDRDEEVPQVCRRNHALDQGRHATRRHPRLPREPSPNGAACDGAAFARAGGAAPARARSSLPAGLAARLQRARPAAAQVLGL